MRGDGVSDLKKSCIGMGKPYGVRINFPCGKKLGNIFITLLATHYILLLKYGMKAIDRKNHFYGI